MNFIEYQEVSHRTAVYPAVSIEKLVPTQNTAVSEVVTYDLKWVYPILGLVGEAGEVANKVKKIIRDREGDVGQGAIKAIGEELGDVLWYLAETCSALGLDLNEIAKENVAKLQDRQERGKLKGDGDNR